MNLRTAFINQLVKVTRLRRHFAGFFGIGGIDFAIPSAGCAIHRSGQ